MIHHTAGYYNDGTRKTNGVKCKNLAVHIRYNVRFRFGRAFFVDGICLNSGNLSDDRIVEIEKDLRFEKADKDTEPYQ